MDFVNLPPQAIQASALLAFRCAKFYPGLTRWIENWNVFEIFIAEK
jgi:hypothetical protein